MITTVEYNNSTILGIVQHRWIANVGPYQTANQMALPSWPISSYIGALAAAAANSTCSRFGQQTTEPPVYLPRPRLRLTSRPRLPQARGRIGTLLRTANHMAPLLLINRPDPARRGPFLQVSHTVRINNIPLPLSITIGLKYLQL